MVSFHSTITITFLNVVCTVTYLSITTSNELNQRNEQRGRNDFAPSLALALSFCFLLLASFLFNLRRFLDLMVVEFLYICLFVYQRLRSSSNRTPWLIGWIV